MTDGTGGGFQVNPVSRSDANINQPPISQWILLGFALGAFLLGALGFAFGVIALINTSQIVDIAANAARAAAKAETATARANAAEIYAFQVYPELNRLGYPVKTPAEAHATQPPTQEEPKP